MKRLLTFLILLLPLCALSQSKEANECYNKGCELYTAKNFVEAIALFQKCDSLDKAQLSDTSQFYRRAEKMLAQTWHSLGTMYYISGKYEDAVQSESIAVSMYKSLYGENDADYAYALMNLGTYAEGVSDQEMSVMNKNKAREIFKKIYGEKSEGYATAINNIAVLYAEYGKYDIAIKFMLEALDAIKEVLGENSLSYATSLLNLGVLCRLTGNYTEAIKHISKSVEIYKNVAGEDCAEYGIAVDYLSTCYALIGNYDEAIRFVTIAMDYFKRKHGENDKNYATTMANLALYNYYKGNYNEAIRLGKIENEITKQLVGESHFDYAASLNNLAAFYSAKHNYAEAVRLQALATDIYKKLYGEKHPYYAKAVNNLAVTCGMAGNYVEALRCDSIAVALRKKLLGDKHPDYASSLMNYAFHCYQSRKFEDAEVYFRRAHSNIRAFVLKNFAVMTSKERANLWKIFSKENLAVYAYEMSQDSVYKGSLVTRRFAAVAFNNLVFTKGLLLNSELEIQNVIERSGDTVMLNRYNKLKADRARLDNIYEMSEDKRTVDADSLLKVVEDSERSLVEDVRELDDYTKYLAVDWKDIQKKLKRKDVAIEYASFKDTTGERIFVAFVLKKGMANPELVKLFGYDDFLEVPSYDYYDTPKLYKLVWSPLDKYLYKAKNVYFSPASNFHTIGIEYLPDEDSVIFAHKYNAYRLSSTRELALKRKKNSNKKAVTIGGIMYDTGDTIVQTKKRSGSGSHADYLPGTKIESEAVANLLQSAKYNTEALSDTLATEESFKQLSGTGIKILHIGTHGFYFDETDLVNAGYKFYTASNQSDEDRDMSCSGLLFAGANATFDPGSRSSIPDGDDGVLTAKEISRLDFKGLELVALSACETGLGKVTGEGVFGLQRGFKKAGAQTIVMSLWPVSDASTEMLMVNFFKKLTSGMSKREAFLSAQSVVRAKYPSPRDWAAFVMVDGL